MDTLGGVEAREMPLSAADGSRESAASADSADRREVGAENAKTLLPQRTQRSQRKIEGFSTKSPGQHEPTI